MEQGYILDSNIAIYLLQGRLSPKASDFLKPVLRSKPNIPIITRIELLSWDEFPAVSHEFVNASHIFPLDDNGKYLH